MRTKKKAPARQVKIPAGKNYIVFPEGSKVYVQEPGEAFPDELAKQMAVKEEQAYVRGMTDAQRDQDNLCKRYTKEESLAKMLQVLNCHHVADQNEIIAVILDEVTKQRVKRLKELQADQENINALINGAQDCIDGLALIRMGGFERLKFR